MNGIIPLAATSMLVPDSGNGHLNSDRGTLYYYNGGGQNIISTFCNAPAGFAFYFFLFKEES